MPSKFGFETEEERRRREEERRRREKAERDAQIAALEAKAARMNERARRYDATHLARGGAGRLDGLGDVPRDEAQLDGHPQGL